MQYVLAEAQTVILMSVVKPVLALLLIAGWGYIATQLDKDAAYFHLKRERWNAGHLAAGIVGLALLLLIPFFFVGLLLAAAVLAGPIVGYIYYRNQEVPATAKWTFSLDTFTRHIDEFQQAQAQRRATVTLLARDESPLDVPRGDHPNAKAHDVLESVLDFALTRRAERVEIGVDGQQANLAVTIDGMKYPQPAVEPALVMGLIDYLKSIAGLDVSDRRKKQGGTLRIDAGELGRHKLDLETAGSTRGLVLQLDIDRDRRVSLPVTHIGLLDVQRKQLDAVVNEPTRVVLVAAPPKQGTTTTLYSLVQHHDPYTSSINVFGEEQGIELEGISFKQLAEGTAPAVFNEQLGILLRTDPDVVLLPRLADAQSARLLARNVEHGRFYTSVPGGDTFEGLKSWVKLVGEHRAAAESLEAIISQRLVRKLCPTCRTPYQPDPAALKKLNLPADKARQFYRASGQVMVKDKPMDCPNCHGLGYMGRTGVFELMPLDDTARDYIGNNQVDRLRTHLRKSRMLWLQEAALMKVVDGTTDIKEITRVLGDKFSAAGRSGAPATAADKPAPAAKQVKQD